MRWFRSPSALGLVAIAGCGVFVEDRTPPFPPRDPAGFHQLTVRIEKAVPGVGISSVQAVTQFGTVPLAPGGGPGMWQGTLELNPCRNGYGVRFEASWNLLLAANTERDPARGVHQKWFAEPPPANCPPSGSLFVVDSIVDLPDANPGDGLCRMLAGSACTLRAAVMEANALAGQDRIELGSATYKLTLIGDDDNAASGDLDLLDEVAITGSGAVIEASGGRAIDVSPTGRAINAELRGITVRGGSAKRGAGIRNLGRLHLFGSTVRDNHADGDAAAGGGILNDGGYVEIVDSEVADNTTGMNAGTGALGAGLASVGEQAMVVVRDSSFVANHSRQHGGAMAILEGRLEMRDSSVSGNRADVHGGGLLINPQARAELRNVTITDNHADFDDSGGGNGGGLLHGGGDAPAFLSHVLLAGNFNGKDGVTPDDCSGSLLQSYGHNLVGSADGCSGLDASDLAGSFVSPLDPLLGALTTLSSGTRGHVPKAGSPAVDAGRPDPENDARPSRCTHVDQRGTLRPQGPLVDGRKRCDIGAVER